MSVALDAPFQCHVGDPQTIAEPTTAARISLSGTGNLCWSVVVVVAFQMAFWQRPFIGLYLVEHPLEMVHILPATGWTLRLNI